MSLDGYTRFEVSRQGRILTATIKAPGPVNAVDAALHAGGQGRHLAEHTVTRLQPETS